MAKTRNHQLKLDQYGSYTKQLGRKEGTAGLVKWRLGKDHGKAMLAVQKLTALWEQVIDDHAHRHAMTTAFDDPTPAAPATWDHETLSMAHAIANHQSFIAVAPHEHDENGAAYASHLDYMRHRYGHILAIIPKDQAKLQAGQAVFAGHVKHRQMKLDHAIRLSGIEGGAAVNLTGQRLHVALDEYSKHCLAASHGKDFGAVQVRQLATIKEAAVDMDLAQFNLAAIEKIKAHFTARPFAKLRGGKVSNRRISIDTIRNTMATLKRFMQWLDRSETYRWELPKHIDATLKINYRGLKTSEEVSAMANGVQVFSVDQLSTIYQHATPITRLFLLLGLNCAMAQNEIITLNRSDVDLKAGYIKCIRQKTHVFGQFKLWPETIKALKEHMSDHQHKTAAVVTEKGSPYTRQRISNLWYQTKLRIEKAGGDVTSWLAFKHLRKTSADLIRAVAGGEVAGVHLSHGQPVKGDDLSEAYSNRPWAALFDAQDKVRQQLGPVFAKG